MNLRSISLAIGIMLFGQFAFGQYYYLTCSGDTPGGLNQYPAYPTGGGQVGG